jgi:hypothetical protein
LIGDGVAEAEDLMTAKEKRDWTALVFSSGGVIAILGLGTSFYVQTNTPDFRGIVTERSRCELVKELAIAQNPNAELREEARLALDKKIGDALLFCLNLGVEK